MGSFPVGRGGNTWAQAVLGCSSTLGRLQLEPCRAVLLAVHCGSASACARACRGVLPTPLPPGQSQEREGGPSMARHRPLPAHRTSGTPWRLRRLVGSLPLVLGIMERPRGLPRAPRKVSGKVALAAALGGHCRAPGRPSGCASPLLAPGLPKPRRGFMGRPHQPSPSPTLGPEVTGASRRVFKATSFPRGLCCPPSVLRVTPQTTLVLSQAVCRACPSGPGSVTQTGFGPSRPF